MSHQTSTVPVGGYRGRSTSYKIHISCTPSYNIQLPLPSGRVLLNARHLYTAHWAEPALYICRMCLVTVSSWSCMFECPLCTPCTPCVVPISTRARRALRCSSSAFLCPPSHRMGLHDITPRPHAINELKLVYEGLISLFSLHRPADKR